MEDGGGSGGSSTSTARSIVISCHGTEMRVQFIGADPYPFPELKSCYYEAFGKIERMLDFEPTAKEFVDIEEPAFQLLDQQYEIFYEGFSSEDIYDGAIIKVEPVLLKSQSEITVYKAQKETEEMEKHAEEATKSLRTSVMTAAKLRHLLRDEEDTQGEDDDTAAGKELEHDEGSSSPLVPAVSSSPFDGFLPGTMPEDSSMGNSNLSVAGRLIGVMADERPQPAGSSRDSFNIDHASTDSRQGLRNASSQPSSHVPSAMAVWQSRGIASRKRVSSFKESVWTALNNPLSSNLAAALTLLIIFFIVISAAVLLLHTFPNFHHPSATHHLDAWFVTESILVAFFTIEVLARMWSCPAWRTFWFDMFNIIDLLSVLPYYCEIILMSLGVNVPELLHLVQLIRIFRLIKISKGSGSVFAETMRSSMRLLYMLLFMVLISVLAFGSLIYFVENARFNPVLGVNEHPDYFMCPLPRFGDNYTQTDLDRLSKGACRPAWDRFADTGAEYMCQYSWAVNKDCVLVYGPSTFGSIYHATWFVMQTISTVGFGDMTPVSDAGKCIGAVIIMFGMVVVSLPITVIGANFSRTYRGHQRQLWANQELYQYQDLPWLKKVTFNLIYS